MNNKLSVLNADPHIRRTQTKTLTLKMALRDPIMLNLHASNVFLRIKSTKAQMKVDRNARRRNIEPTEYK